MYTKFIKNFNSFFGKKGSYIFSSILVIFSILLMAASLYAFSNIRTRDNKYIEKYVTFKNDKGYYIGEKGEEEVTFLSYNDGSALNPGDYNNKILRMFCLKNDNKNCFYVKNIYSYNYVSFGFAMSIVLLSLGLVCIKLYKVRNTNHGSVKVFRPFMITLFIFGAYLFTYQIYNLIDYMRFSNNMNKITGNVIGTFEKNYLIEYIVDEKHYSTLVSMPKDKMKHNQMEVKYSKNDSSITYEKTNFNILILISGIIISYLSMMFIISEKEIDKKIKISEKKSKKESYRRKNEVSKNHR